MFKKPLLAFALVCGVVVVGGPAASAGPNSCANRNNNTVDKLLECVTVDGVRTHQAALQAIADDNNGIRTSGTPGYDASAAYVADTLEAAGYDVTVEEFDFQTFIELSPTVLEQTSPVAGPIVTNIMSYSGSGDDTASVSTVSAITGCDANRLRWVPGWGHRVDQSWRLLVRVEGDQRVQRRGVGCRHLQQHPRHAERHAVEHVCA